MTYSEGLEAGERHYTQQLVLSLKVIHPELDQRACAVLVIISLQILESLFRDTK